MDGGFFPRVKVLTMAYDALTRDVDLRDIVVEATRLHRIQIDIMVIMIRDDETSIRDIFLMKTYVARLFSRSYAVPFGRSEIGLSWIHSSYAFIYII
jgi:hypothetical protein